MRILWVKAGRLLPVDTGGKIRSFNILKHLSQWNDLGLLSYYAGPRDEAYEEDLNRLFPGAIAMPVPLPRKSSLKGRWDYLKGLFVPLPYAVYKHTTADVRSHLGRLLVPGSVDIAICDFLAPSANFEPGCGVPVILFEHNVEALLWRRQAAHHRNGIASALYRLEAAKMLKYERSVIRSFDHIIAVSENDGQWFRDIVGPSRVSVVPTGVDTSIYHPDERPAPDGNLIVFSGSMDWGANADAVVHFCKAILPIVRHRIPEARFRIVGRAPGPAVRNLASQTVEVTGTVDSVVPHLRRAAVVVVPLRIGGGTRLKILEAMAMGKAVVSTNIGAEGLNLRDGSEIILADQPSDFAAAIVRLMQNERERHRLEQNAAALARNYVWDGVAAQFQRVLADVLNESATRSAVPVTPSPIRTAISARSPLTHHHRSNGGSPGLHPFSASDIRGRDLN